jgi:hypothetical protein
MFKILNLIAGILLIIWCVGFLICNESIQIHTLLVAGVFAFLLQKYTDKNEPKN